MKPELKAAIAALILIGASTAVITKALDMAHEKARTEREQMNQPDYRLMIMTKPLEQGDTVTINNIDEHTFTVEHPTNIVLGEDGKAKLMAVITPTDLDKFRQTFLSEQGLKVDHDSIEIVIEANRLERIETKEPEQV